MLTIAIYVAYTLIGAALLLNLWRVLRGPGMPDRALALDTMYINGIALLMVFGVHLADSLYFEVALLIAVMGFVSTAAICKYLLRGDIIE